MKRCAVIVAARDAARYVRYMVESFQQLDPLKGWLFELRVGVDACPSTAAVLRDMNVRHHMSAVQVGPYIMRNSLIALAPADCYATFDADDQMKPAYLAKLIPLAIPAGISGAFRLETEKNGKIRALKKADKPIPWTWGVSVYSAKALEKLGGFMPWQTAADRDIIMRAKALGIPLQQHNGLPRALYYRRLHPNQNSSHPEWGRKTAFRKELDRISDSNVAQGLLKIEPEVVPLVAL